MSNVSELSSNRSAKALLNVALILLAGAASTIFAADTAAQNEPTPAPISFSRDVAPILAKKCLTCHGPEKAKGGYRLHIFELMLKAGDDEIAPIVPGKPEQSGLYRRLITKDDEDRMPQKDDPLSAANIGLIERWIREGARFDGSDPKALLTSIIPQGPHPSPPTTYRQPVPLTAVAFSPDGRELAVGGYHEITIWDPSSGKLLRRIKNVAQRTQSLAYQPRGSFLAAAGGSPGQAGEVALFNPVEGSLVKVLGTMSDMVLSICFSEDGTRLAAGGADNAIHLYDVASGKEQLLIQQHADWVLAVAFDQKGGHLASASRDRSARIYDTKTGELEMTYADHGAPVFGIGFSGDGKSAYSGGRDKKIHVWNIKDAKKSGELSGFEEDIIKLLVKGDYVFSCSADRLVRQHDAKERKLVHTYSGHKDWVYTLDYHSATSRLATGSHDGEVRIWSTEDGKLQTVFVAAPGYLTADSSK